MLVVHSSCPSFIACLAIVQFIIVMVFVVAAFVSISMVARLSMFAAFIGSFLSSLFRGLFFVSVKQQK